MERTGASDVRQRLDRRPARSWTRTILRCIAILLVTIVLFALGPLIFSGVVAVLLIADWLLGRSERTERAIDLRERRKERLEQAIASGGPSDRPTRGRRHQSPAEIAKTQDGPKHPTTVWGWWPRGRV